jgi:aspartyl-tRNA(Asn)/glutamyl-tRNA(Gln) amidotransferase subunit C
MICPMSQDSTELARRMAELARLQLTPEALERYGGQFARILEAFRSLAELDVEGVEPMRGPIELSDVMREDIERPSLPRAALLANAPEPSDGFYAVPKTIVDEP